MKKPLSPTGDCHHCHVRGVLLYIGSWYCDTCKGMRRICQARKERLTSPMVHGSNVPEQGALL